MAAALAIVIILLSVSILIGCGYLAAKRYVAKLGIWRAVESQDLHAIESYANGGGDLEVGARLLGRTPLLSALFLRKKESYRKLLSLGASPDTVCTGGQGDLIRSSVLHHAAFMEDSFWLEQALAAGGNPNQMNQAEGLSQGTPLYCAVGGGDRFGRVGNVRNVELLCDYGADVDAPCNGSGETALAVASGEGKWKCVHLLLEKGADPLKSGDVDVKRSFMEKIRHQKPDSYRGWGDNSEAQVRAVWDWLTIHGMDPGKATWNGSKWVFE